MEGLSRSIRSVRRRVTLTFFGAQALRCFLALALAISAASAALSWGAAGRLFAALAAGVGALGALFVGAAALRRWRASGGSLAILERRYGVLRNDLSTFLQWKEDPSFGGFGYSPALLGELARALDEKWRSLPAAEQYGWTAFARAQRYPLALFGLLLALLFFGRGGSDLSLLFHPGSRTEAARPGTREAASEFHVGNLFAQLRPPAYTGLPAEERKAVSGRLSGLEGTSVLLEFETDRPVERLGLVSPGGEFFPAEGGGARAARVRFLLKESGTAWFQGRAASAEARDPKGLEILVTPDRPPSVELLAPPGEVEVDPDGEVPFVYRARDDFGIASLRLKVSGRTFRQEIRLPAAERGERAREGEYKLRLSQLPISDAERSLAAEIVATDNDRVGGPKEGSSAAVTLRLRDPEEARQNRLLGYGRWKQLLLTVLANDLERPAEFDRLWQEDSRVVRSIQESLRRDSPADRKGRARLEGFGRLIDRIVARRAGAQPPGSDPAGAEIPDVEQAVLWLDRAESREKTDRVAEASGRLDGLARRFAEAFSEPSAGAGREALAEALEELRRALEALARSLREAAAADAEFLNLEALEGKDLESLAGRLSEIDRLLREGKLEEARRLLADYSRTLREFAQNFRAQTRHAVQAVDEKTRREWAAGRDELKALRDSQRKLLDDTARFRDSAGERAPEARAAIGALLAKAEELGGHLERAHAQGARDLKEAWRNTIRERLPSAKREARRLKENLERRLLFRAKAESEQLGRTLDQLLAQGERMHDWFGRSIPSAPGAGPPAGLKALRQAHKTAQEIRRLLEEAEATAASRPASPGERRKAGELEGRQRRLEKKAGEWETTMKRLDRKFGVFGAEGGRQMGAARKHMEGAAQRLEEGDAGRAAVEQKEAVAFLDELWQQMESASSSLPGAPPAGTAGGARSAMSSEPVLLPGPSRAGEAEAWWEAIVRATKEPPPAGYEAPTRDYFRELSQ